MAYVGVNFFGLGIVDVSNPATPTLRGSFKTPGQAKTAAIFGTKVLIVDHMAGSTSSTVESSRSRRRSVRFSSTATRAMSSRPAPVYAVDSPTGFYVLDLPKPNPLEPLGSLQSGTAFRAVEASGTLAVLLAAARCRSTTCRTPHHPSERRRSGRLAARYEFR